MSGRTNPGRHPPSRSSESPQQEQQQQQNFPVFSAQTPSTQFGVAANMYPEIQISNLPQLQTFGNPLQGSVSRPSQSLPPQRQAPPQSSSSPSSRHSSTPTHPKPIPQEKLKKAVRLWNDYCMAKMLEEQQQTTIYPGGPRNVPAPGSSGSAASGNNSRVVPTSRTGSAYGGTTDLSSVIDFPDGEGNTSPTGRGHEGRSVYNGKIVRTRRRNALNGPTRAKAALIRHLNACSSCHSRSVGCELHHQDIAAIIRESERLGTQALRSPIRRPHSQSQPLQRPPPINSVTSSHDPMRSASTGQIPEVGMNNLLFGLSQNDHFLGTTSPTSANDPQSPSQFPDLLAGIQAQETGQLPFGAPNSVYLTRLGLETDTPANECRDGALFVIGIKRPEGLFACSGGTIGGGVCTQSMENPEMLQLHFEQEHFPFTRIDPAHRYVCRSCQNVSNLPVNLCLACGNEYTCETRIYGRFINTSSDHTFTTDDQSPFSPFSPDSNNFSGFGFDFQGEQNMGHDNSMGSSGNGNMNQGGGFNYLSSNQYQSPNTHGRSHGNPNSSRNSQPDDFQFQGNQFTINAVVDGKFDYFHAKGRQKLHRHRLLAITLILSALLVLQASTWIITKEHTAITIPRVGFMSMIASFVGSYAYWAIKDSVSQKYEFWVHRSFAIRPAKPLGSSHSSPEHYFRTTISVC